jgi:hypothetical protein
VSPPEPEGWAAARFATWPPRLRGSVYAFRSLAFCNASREITVPLSPSSRDLAHHPRMRRPALLCAAAISVAALAAGASGTASAAPAPQVTVNSTTLTPLGALNVASVSGFGPNDALTFTIDGVNVTNELVSTTTDSTGAITTPLGNLRLPGANGGSVGTHTLTVADATAKLQASVTLHVVPSPTPTPTTVQRTVSQMGTMGVTVTFTGFTPGDGVIIGMANQVNGAQCGATVIATADGTATGTCVWDASYLAQFGRVGSSPSAGAFIIGANNTLYTMYSTFTNVTVTPNAVAPTPPPATKPPRTVTPPVASPSTPKTAPAAGPAVPVRGTATFTG